MIHHMIPLITGYVVQGYIVSTRTGNVEVTLSNIPLNGIIETSHTDTTAPQIRVLPVLTSVVQSIGHWE